MTVFSRNLVFTRKVYILTFCFASLWFYVTSLKEGDCKLYAFLSFHLLWKTPFCFGLNVFLLQCLKWLNCFLQYVKHYVYWKLCDYLSTGNIRCMNQSKSCFLLILQSDGEEGIYPLPPPLPSIRHGEPVLKCIRMFDFNCSDFFFCKGLISSSLSRSRTSRKKDCHLIIEA